MGVARYVSLPYIFDLTLCPFLVLPSSQLVANIVLSLSFRVPILRCRYRLHLGFSKICSFVDVADIKELSTIDNFVTIVDEVHCKDIDCCCEDARYTKVFHTFIFIVQEKMSLERMNKNNQFRSSNFQLFFVNLSYIKCFHNPP